MFSDNITHGQTQISSVSEQLFDYAKKLGFGDLHFKLDEETGLFAVIAIHSTELGPALGGCRLRRYPSIVDAIYDAIRLAHGMTYKAAITGVALGGGKSVLIKPEIIADRKKYFQAFGNFVEELNGRYITAVDSGTSTTDMDYVATKTKHVTSTSAQDGDPSPYTARGVLKAIQAGVKFRYGRDDLTDIHIAIQGVGHVGYHLAKSLNSLGAKLTITDTSPEALERCALEFGAHVVPPEQIYSIDCDIFTPCALGAIINNHTVNILKAKMVIGSANNQLFSAQHGELLHQQNILYAPDYVVNAGGLICAYSQYYQTPREEIIEKVDDIYTTTMNIFERAQKENRATNFVADTIAEEKLAAGGKP